MATKNGKPNNCDCKCHPTEMVGTGTTKAKACCNGLHCPSYCSCCQILQAENSDRVKAETKVRELELQVDAMRSVVEAAQGLIKAERWPYLLGGGFLAHAIDAYEKTLTEKRKCPSTYSHSTHGKLTCEKDAAHLSRAGDVEHYSRNVKWMSV